MEQRSSPPPDGPYGERGLVLLDLLLGLAVLSLLLLIALPYVRPGTSPLRQEAYVAEIAALLKSERAAAAQNGRAGVVRIDVPARRFSAGALARSIVLPSDLGLDVTSSEGCGGDRAHVVLAFDADGRSCGAVIRVERAGRVWTVQINWLTGYVDVHKAT